MAESSTLIPLPQMADLALNCPEMGILNFRALHTLLHVMISQGGLGDVAIEFRGIDSERLQTLIAATRPSPAHGFGEYSIVGSKKRKGKRSVSLQDIKEQIQAEEKKEAELRVIERRKDSKEDPALSPLPLKSPPTSNHGIKGPSNAPDSSLQTIVVVESASKLPQFSVAVSKTHFDELQKDVAQLKENVKQLTELPGNLDLIEATRGNSSPILDMYQILNLTKRMDGAEIGMEKIISLIEDLARETQGGEASQILQQTKDVRQSMLPLSRHGSSTGSLVEIENRLTRLENHVNEIANGHVDRSSIGIQETAGDDEVRKASKAAERTKIMILGGQEPPQSVLDGVNLSEIPATQALLLVQQEFMNLKDWIEKNNINLDELKGGHPEGEGTAVSPEDVQKIATVDSKFAECTKQVKELDALYNNQIGILNEQLGLLQKEVTDVLTKIDIILPGGDSTGINAETTMELASKLLLLEKEMITISETAAKLQEEKEERDKHIDVIMEQIDILKIVKANREDLEDALGDKADACMINRKVSHDQFDAACDDLSRGIEEALTKLQDQEEMWQQALDALQRDVGNKLDRMEVDPLRDFVNSKLKALQDKFKSLTALKKEQEAAGTKSKYLRDVNCISCDKDVVMRKEMDVTLKPKPYALPPSRNMAPYLAYELDQLRKGQKCIPNSKNLNYFENALKTRASKDKDHLCNRYCGGSHTVTTPQQRVTRLGHFLEQWGPEIAPLNDEYIRGNDNHMYKARDESVIKKVSVQNNQNVTPQGSARGTQDEMVTKDGEIQREQRLTLVTESIQEALAQEAERKRLSNESKRVHSIGSAGRNSVQPRLSDSRLVEQTGSPTQAAEPRLSQQRGSPSQSMEQRLSQQRGSQGQPTELRASQARGLQVRTSQDQAAQPRGSQARSEGRVSQARSAEPRFSQVPQSEPRASQIQQSEPRASQVQPSEPRASQVQQSEPRTSQVQPSEPRASQVQQSEPRASQVQQSEPRASQVQQSEPRASQVQQSEPRASQVQQPETRASQAQQSQPRFSQVPQSEPRASQASQPREPQVQTTEPRSSSTSQPRESQAQTMEPRPSQLEPPKPSMSPSAEGRVSVARQSEGRRSSIVKVDAKSETRQSGARLSQDSKMDRHIGFHAE